MHLRSGAKAESFAAEKERSRLMKLNEVKAEVNNQKNDMLKELDAFGFDYFEEPAPAPVLLVAQTSNGRQKDEGMLIETIDEAEKDFGGKTRDEATSANTVTNNKQALPKSFKDTIPAGQFPPNRPIYYKFNEDRTENDALIGERVRVLGPFAEFVDYQSACTFFENLGAVIESNLTRQTTLIVYGMIEDKSASDPNDNKGKKKAKKSKKNKKDDNNPAVQPNKAVPKLQQKKQDSDNSDSENEDFCPQTAQNPNKSLLTFKAKRDIDHPEIKTAIANRIPIISEFMFLNNFYNFFGVYPIQNDIKNPNLVGKVKRAQLRSVDLAVNQGRLWVDIFAPKSSSDIIGNKETVAAIKKYILDFPNRRGEPTFEKAVLLAGLPGIGKTTAANICASELGYRVIVQNASDSRNKGDVNKFVGAVKDNTVLNSTFVTTSEKCLLIMDEVDGMSGDKGGMAALIQQIKETRIPIICICNDAGSAKIRSLMPYCKVLRFEPPSDMEVKALLERIQNSIGTASPLDQKIDFWELVVHSGSDLRQAISNLQFKCLGYQKKNGCLLTEIQENDTGLNAVDATKRLIDEAKREKIDIKRMKQLFFCDYSLIPFYIFDNYLGRPFGDPEVKNVTKSLSNASKALDSMMFADQLNRKMTENSEYRLLEQYCISSTILPVLIMDMWKKIPPFPTILGKVSSINKAKRMFQELGERFCGVTGFLNPEGVWRVAFALADYFGNEYKGVEYGAVEKEPFFDHCFQICKEFNLDQVTLKEHIPEIIKLSTSVPVGDRYLKFLNNGFLNYFKAKFGNDGVVGQMSKAKKKGAPLSGKEATADGANDETGSKDVEEEQGEEQNIGDFD